MGDVCFQDLWSHRLEGVLESVVGNGELVTVRARASAERGRCPACEATSSRVHSRYVHRLVDSAVGGLSVVIELRVRRFCCTEYVCPQAAFAAQDDGLTFRHGQRSAGMQSVLERLAVILAGRAGARMAPALMADVRRFDAPAPDTGPAGSRNGHATGARRGRVRAAQRTQLRHDLAQH
ncbi:transposase family protein [Streptomyces sp. NBRC 13847]|uniref:transposase family protein n=1 Tax=Streptomyces sp. NBRC 13847 TaxID=3030991 RepID=UPI00331EC0DA